MRFISLPMSPTLWNNSISFPSSLFPPESMKLPFPLSSQIPALPLPSLSCSSDSKLLFSHPDSKFLFSPSPCHCYVDQHLRQQRALQEFGVMRHAWRPQRGLPESSISILHAWLFKDFLHPYPKESEKIMLAKETGLTINQVANWFINARVRLWKPMVEEMYKEEFGKSDLNSQSSPENDSKAPRDNFGAFEDKGEELQDSVISTTTDGVRHGQAHESKFVNVEINGKTTGIETVSKGRWRPTGVWIGEDSRRWE